MVHDFPRWTIVALIAGIVACGPSIGAARADSIYDEDVQGDLSGNYQIPTTWNVSAGVNSLFATTGNSGTSLDLEYVHLALPEGHQLSHIYLQFYEGVDELAFMAVQSGPAFTFLASSAGSNINNMLGWAHVGPGGGHTEGTDLLPIMGQLGMGFTPPLVETDLTFWIQQTGDIFSYQLDFIVEPVPEPGAIMLSGFAFAFAVGFRRKPMLLT